MGISSARSFCGIRRLPRCKHTPWVPIAFLLPAQWYPNLNPSNFQLECRFVPGFYAHDQRKCYVPFLLVQEINHTYLGKVLGHSAVEVHRREGRPAPSSHAAIDVAHRRGLGGMPPIREQVCCAGRYMYDQVGISGAWSSCKAARAGREAAREM